MSAALLIDILLWGSVAAVGFIAWRRGRVVLVSSLREGSLEFINIVPRIALGVIGSGYIAAGDRLCGGLGAVRVPAPDSLGNPVHAGALRLVPRGGVGAVSVPGSGDRDGDREALRPDRLPKKC